MAKTGSYDVAQILNVWVYHTEIVPNDAEGIANSETLIRSSLIWVYTLCPNLSVRKRRIIKVGFLLGLQIVLLL